MGMQSQIWSHVCSTPSAAPSVKVVSIEDVKAWLRVSLAGDDDFGRENRTWQTQFAVVSTWISDEKCFSSLDGDDLLSLQALLVSFGQIHLDAITSADTISFNSHTVTVPGEEVNLFRQTLCYSISDSVFGICWKWEPRLMCTKGLIWYCSTEGNIQLQYVL